MNTLNTAIRDGSPILPELQRVSPELWSLLATALGLSERAAPLVQWRDHINNLYAAHAKNTRLKMAQAVRETLALAGPGATTADLTRELVARLAARGGAASTTNGLLSALRRACKLAQAEGWLSWSRMNGAVWRVKETTPRPKRHHSRAAVRRVLATLESGATSWDGGRLFTSAAIYAFAGLRRREGQMLRWEHIDLTDGFLWVQPQGHPLKTEDSLAPVPAPRALRHILAGWRSRCRSDWVIPKVDRTGPWTGGSSGRRLTDRLVAAGAECGVQGFTPLSLRHSLATQLAVRLGLSQRQIQLVLRHSNEDTQLTYIHPDLVELGRVMDGFSYLPGRPRSRDRLDCQLRMITGRKRRRPAWV